MVISAERLLGGAYASRTWAASRNTAQVDETGTTFGPLGGSTPALFVVPRLAFDAFLLDHLSLGAALSYFRSSLDESIDSQFTFQSPNRSSDVLVLAPRVGYALRLGSRVFLWPRLGFTYAWAHSNGTASQTLGLYALTGEAMLGVRVFEGAYVEIGPVLDQSFKGAASFSAPDAPPTPNRRLDETDVGVVCGLGGYF